MANIEFKVNGMMCEGCEKRVQNVIKEIDGVIDVKADHKVGIVEINTEKEIDESIIKEAIEDIGYEVKYKG